MSTRVGTRPLRIALLGAESTGKSTVTEALVAHLRSNGLAAHGVPEVLRGWCNTRGRTPQPHEQAGIAREQARLTLLAGLHDAQAVTVADTTPLMTAIYSDLLFADTSLYPFAEAHQRHAYDVTLLMGLDLPWVADPLRDGPHVRAPVDARIRAALARAGVAHALVYGSGPQRLVNTVNAINSIATNPIPIYQNGQKTPEYRRWRGACECCGDPDCERQLFRQLRAGSAVGADSRSD